jgi:hypothetical protein
MSGLQYHVAVHRLLFVDSIIVLWLLYELLFTKQIVGLSLMPLICEACKGYEYVLYCSETVYGHEQELRTWSYHWASRSEKAAKVY